MWRALNWEYRFVKDRSNERNMLHATSSNIFVCNVLHRLNTLLHDVGWLHEVWTKSNFMQHRATGCLNGATCCTQQCWTMLHATCCVRLNGPLVTQYKPSRLVQFSLPHLYVSLQKVGRMYCLCLGVKGSICTVILHDCPDVWPMLFRSSVGQGNIYYAAACHTDLYHLTLRDPVMEYTHINGDIFHLLQAECRRLASDLGEWIPFKCSQRPSGQTRVHHGLRPCCHVIGGQCSLTTAEHCEFIGGFFHTHGEHCAEVRKRA